jgi:hypothetical protein
MKLYVYEIALYKEDAQIQIKAVTCRERKVDYFSENYMFICSEERTNGGWSVSKKDIKEKKVFYNNRDVPYFISLKNTDIEIAKPLLIPKVIEIIEIEKERLRIKEVILSNLSK